MNNVYRKTEGVNWDLVKTNPDLGNGYKNKILINKKTQAVRVTTAWVDDIR